jgi:hypothetical protein
MVSFGFSWNTVYLFHAPTRSTAFDLSTVTRIQPLTRHLGETSWRDHPEKDYCTLFHVSARKVEKSSSSQNGTKLGGPAGSLAGSNYNLLVKYPKDNDLQLNSPVQGSRGIRKKRTLVTFSFDSQVGVITGNMRGLDS